jgi:platelet-activating factor acetylhydrolase
MFLPNPGGRFPVGATTFKLAVPRRPLSSVKVRSGTSSELKHALVLEEVAFTAYYPADVPLKSTPRGLSWLLRFVGTPWFAR